MGKRLFIILISLAFLAIVGICQQSDTTGTTVTTPPTTTTTTENTPTTTQTTTTQVKQTTITTNPPDGEQTTTPPPSDGEQAVQPVAVPVPVPVAVPVPVPTDGEQTTTPPPPPVDGETTTTPVQPTVTAVIIPTSFLTYQCTTIQMSGQCTIPQGVTGPVCGFALDQNSLQLSRFPYTDVCAFCQTPNLQYPVYFPGACDQIPATVEYCPVRRFIYTDGEYFGGLFRESCDQINQPVCGHFKKGFCVGNKRALTFMNKCQACLNDLIDYFTPGPCSSADQLPTAQDTCKLNRNSYRRIFRDQLLTTTDCNAFATPVCGITFPGYTQQCDTITFFDGEQVKAIKRGRNACMVPLTNLCDAQSQNKLQAFIDLPCTAIPDQVHYCTIPSSQGVCESGYKGKVCGHYIRNECTNDKKQAKTFNNECDACKDPLVDYVTEGECTTQELNYFTNDGELSPLTSQYMDVNQYCAEGEDIIQKCPINYFDLRDGEQFALLTVPGCVTYYDESCKDQNVGYKTVLGGCGLNNFMMENKYKIISVTQGMCPVEGCSAQCTDLFANKVCFKQNQCDPTDTACLAGKTYNTYCDAFKQVKDEYFTGHIYDGECCNNDWSPVCAIYKDTNCYTGHAAQTYTNRCQAVQMQTFLLDIIDGECSSLPYVEDRCSLKIFGCPLTRNPVCSHFLDDTCTQNQISQLSYPNWCVAGQDRGFDSTLGTCQKQGCFLQPEVKVQLNNECPTYYSPVCAIDLTKTCTDTDPNYQTFDNYCQLFQAQTQNTKLQFLQYGACNIQSCQLPCWLNNKSSVSDITLQPMCLIQLNVPECPVGRFITLTDQCELALYPNVSPNNLIPGACLNEGCF